MIEHCDVKCRCIFLGPNALVFFQIIIMKFQVVLLALAISGLLLVSETTVEAAPELRADSPAVERSDGAAPAEQERAPLPPGCIESLCG